MREIIYQKKFQHRTDLKHQYSALSHTYPQTWIIGFYVIKFTCCGVPQLAKLNTRPLKLNVLVPQQIGRHLGNRVQVTASCKTYV